MLMTYDLVGEIMFLLLVFTLLLYFGNILLRGEIESFYRANSRFIAMSNCPVFKQQKKPKWVIDELIKLAAHHPPKTGCRALTITFNRCFEMARGETVSKSFVYYTLRNHRYEVAALRETFKRRIPPPMKCNRVWGIDLTGKQTSDGDIHPILGILDHGSRRALTLRALARACTWTLIGEICFAIARFGKPKSIRTDNGAVFTSKVFRWAMNMFCIKRQRTDVGCPWQNGRVEKFFSTLKSKLDFVQISSRESLHVLLNEFSFWYNELRPHQHLDGRTPYEVWNNIDVKKPPRSARIWHGWNGLLAGIVMRR
jgi:putative transposase